jgi:hypothetical protein
MFILGERDPTFIGMQRWEGNITVAAHPTDLQSYGDGSIEISGSVRTDNLRSATPNQSVTLRSPVIWQSLVNPSIPPSSGIQMYSDIHRNGRLVMVDATGTVIDVNPLKSIGDLMTFDALKNTTVRLPSGYAEQILTTNPEANSATNLYWRSLEANVYNVFSPSDEYLRYSETYNSNFLQLTNSPQPLFLNRVCRMDSDSFAVDSSKDFVIQQPGLYEINFWATVYMDSGSTDSACIQTHIEQSEDIVFATVPNTTRYRSIVNLPDSETRNATTVGNHCLLSISAPSRLRFYAREYGSNQDNILKVDPGNARLSVLKLRLEGEESPESQTQCLIARGPPGIAILESQSISLPMQTISFQTNPNDALQNGIIVVAESGWRRIIANTTFISSDANSNLVAVIETQLFINDVSIFTSYSNMVSHESNGTSHINCNYELSAGDTIEIRSKLVQSNLSSGTIAAELDQCGIAIFTPDRWKCLSMVQNPTISSNSIYFSDISFDANVAINLHTTEFNTSPEVAQLIDGGTYHYIYGADVHNADHASSCNCLMRLMVDDGSGYKEIPGSQLWSSLPANGMQTIYGAGTIYLSPRSTIKCQVLSSSGSNVIVVAGTCRVMLNKYEHTLTSHIGYSDFGRFYDFISDEQEVISTNTTFALRLGTITVGLPPGYYRIGMSFEWDMSGSHGGFETQLVLNDSTIIDQFTGEPAVTGIFTSSSTFKHIYLNTGRHFIAFNLRVSSIMVALHTRKVRIEFWKI